MKIAQFRDNVRPKLLSVLQEGSLSAGMDMYTRVSEWVEVDFPQLPPEAHMPQQLQALAREEAELREKLGRVAAIRASLQPSEQS